MTNKINILIAAVGLLFTAACGPDKPAENDSRISVGVEAPLNLQLICEMVRESEEDPRSAVYALVGDSKVKLAEIAACDVIPGDQYGQYQIPANAIMAVGGWWAGFGDYIYASRSGENIEIFMGEMGESENETGVQYRRIAQYTQGQFLFDQEAQ